MDTTHFSTRRALESGWNALRENWGIFPAILAISWVLPAVPAAMAQASGSIGAAIALAIVAYVVASATWLGVLRFTLNVTGGRGGSFSDLFACFHLLPGFIVSSILYALMVSTAYIVAAGVLAALAFAGLLAPTGPLIAGIAVLLLGIVIMIALRYYFYVFYIVREELGPIEALKSSAELTEGIKGQLAMFFLALGLLNLVGLLTGLVLLAISRVSGGMTFLLFVAPIVMLAGLLVTVPTSLIAIADVFSQLRGGASADAPDDEAPADELWPHRRRPGS